MISFLGEIWHAMAHPAAACTATLIKKARINRQVGRKISSSTWVSMLELGAELYNKVALSSSCLSST
jgi:hypothetical protein